MEFFSEKRVPFYKMEVCFLKLGVFLKMIVCFLKLGVFAKM